MNTSTLTSTRRTKAKLQPLKHKLEGAFYTFLFVTPIALFLASIYFVGAQHLHAAHPVMYRTAILIIVAGALVIGALLADASEQSKRNNARRPRP